MTRWHNVFQPIYQVDAQLEFLNSIANEVAGQGWLQFESASLRELFHRHPDIRVHLNIDPVQFAYPSVWAFLKKCHDLYGNHVVIEVTERQSQVQASDDHYFKQAFQKIQALGFKLALDDVGSGGHSLDFVRRHLDMISCIKLSLLIFKGLDQKTTKLFIGAWASFASAFGLDLVLEAVPNLALCAQFTGRDHILIQANVLQKPLLLNEL